MKKRVIIGVSVLSLLVMFTIAPLAVLAEPYVLQPVETVHTVISEKLLYLADGDTGEWYDEVKGYATMSWQNRKRCGFFNAKACVYPKDLFSAEEPKRTIYKFALVAIGNSNSDSIEGLWDVRKNGKLVCKGCVGKAYGINVPVGEYFKLYIGDSECYGEKWHLSGYITDRYDF